MIKQTVYYCPICDWSHTEPLADVSPQVLAGVFGAGVMTAVADVQRNERIERALQAHVEGHSRLDFIKALSEIARSVVRRESDTRLCFSGYSANARARISRAAGLPPSPWTDPPVPIEFRTDGGPSYAERFGQDGGAP